MPSAFPCLASLAAAAACWLGGMALALEIRDYQETRHERLLDFPEQPRWNDESMLPLRSLSGIGWSVEFPNRKATLVSPRHVLMAAHFPVPVDGVVRFLAPDGSVHDRVLIRAETLPNDRGTASDLRLGLLDRALPRDRGPVPFSYLDLMTEQDAIGMSLIVSGRPARVGRGTVGRFQDFEASGLGRTRTMVFPYRKSEGDGDDAMLQGGDSGGGAFVTLDGRHVLVGIHSAVRDLAATRDQFSAYVPHYVDELNLEMAAEGYRMTPARPPFAKLEVEAAFLDGPERLTSGAVLRVVLRNASDVAAGNLRLALALAPGQEPQTVDSAAWVEDEADGVLWAGRLALLEPGEVASLDLRWQTPPASDVVRLTLVREADGSPQSTTILRPALAPSYASWAFDLADPAPLADPDGDGVANLLEYAFGGDPRLASRRRPDGDPLLPVPRPTAAGGLSLSHFVRTDAANRGLRYHFEWAAHPAGPWRAAEELDGFSILDENPLVHDGFFRRHAILEPPAGDAPRRRFLRVRVELAE